MFLRIEDRLINCDSLEGFFIDVNLLDNNNDYVGVYGVYCAIQNPGAFAVFTFDTVAEKKEAKAKADKVLNFIQNSLVEGKSLVTIEQLGPDETDSVRMTSSN